MDFFARLFKRSKQSVVPMTLAEISDEISAIPLRKMPIFTKEETRQVTTGALNDDLKGKMLIKTFYLLDPVSQPEAETAIRDSLDSGEIRVYVLSLTDTMIVCGFFRRETVY